MSNKVCGIYILKFTGTPKVYVGLSKDILARQRHHRYSMIKGIASPKLQEAYKTYGLPTMEILCECLEEELETYEVEAIGIFNSIEEGFNTKSGGAVGPGTHISGAKNGRSKHSEDTYIAVFMELINTNNSYKSISDSYNVSIQIVEHIAAGVSHRSWLQKLFPKEYNVLLDKKNSRDRLSPTILINKEQDIEYEVTSLIEFSKKVSIPKSTLSSIITGAIKNAHGWELKYPVVYSPKTKKEFILINTISKEIIRFTNVLGFCRSYSISNRKSFTKFLNRLDTAEVYFTWAHYMPEVSYDICQSAHNHCHEI